MTTSDPRAAHLHSTVDVRPMEIDDLPKVYHLGEELFTSDLYPFLYRTWDQWEVIGLYNTDAEYCLVAEVDEALAGFILGTVITKASWTYGYIIWLGVSRNFQKKGVADRLVDKLVERMIEEGVRYMLVDTDPRNTPAVKFFTRKGFGNQRDHIFLSMNLVKHERYGRLIVREREREKAKKAQRNQKRKRERERKLEAVVSDPTTLPGASAEPMIMPIGPADHEPGHHARVPHVPDPSGAASGSSLTAFGPPSGEPDNGTPDGEERG